MFRRFIVASAAGMLACLGFGASGRADPSDPVPVTLEGLQQSCDGGEAVDCAALGHLYRRGEEVPQDLSRAIAMFRRGCDLSSGAEEFGSYACHFLAAFYESGEGVPRDLARALQLYEKSCKAGNDDSCSQARVVRLSIGN
ncbi:tetratricopeptide repeat protein [Caulobacter mirabilis]|nr:tetratricopeptide repeat protein [Caulobacter mirabilis]